MRYENVLDTILEAIELDANSEIPKEENKNPFRGGLSNDFSNDFNKDIMALKSKKDLKDVFCGVSSLYMIKGAIEDLTTIDFTHDMPALVDTISYSEGEATKNGVKVHGLDADWCTMYEGGETTFTVDIPTAHPEVLEFFWGAPTKQTSTVNGESWEGEKYKRDSKQIKLGLGILSGDGTKMFVVTEVDAVASNIFESGSTQPHLVRVNGSVASDEFVFLSKKPVGE